MTKHSIQIIFVLGLLFSFGCEEDPPDVELNQFDRAGAIELVCYLGNPDDGIQTLPLDCCSFESAGVSGYCSLPNPEARIAAFITQTTPGEVAVLDVFSEKVVDQEERIPLNSFIPVGGQPLDIASNFDGSKLYTANLETADLSVISVSDAFGPTMENSYAIDVGMPAAQMVIVDHPEGTFGLVTQPTADRLAVVALEVADTICPDQGALGGCYLDSLPLDVTVLDPAIDTASIDTVSPLAVAYAEQSKLAYVAGFAAPVLLEIDAHRLIDEAIQSAAANDPQSTDDPQLGTTSIVRQINTQDVHQGADLNLQTLSVEPDLERWLYATERLTGGVVVVDLLAGGLEVVSDDEGPTANPFVLELVGKARTASLLRLTDSGAAGPLTFNGTFAFVTTTAARMYVIDVQDMDNSFNQPHKVRSAVDLFDTTQVNPSLETAPVLTVDELTLSATQAEELVRFVERTDLDTPCELYGVEADTSSGPDTDAAYYRPEADGNGFHFACDPRNSSNEDWQLNWQGSLGVSGAVVIDYDSLDEEGGEFMVLDSNRDFASDGIIARVPGVGYCETGEFQIPPSYSGDWFEVVDLFSEEAPEECARFDNRRLLYQIVDVIDGNTLVLSNDNFTNPTPLPTKECFGGAVHYEIRAFGHWVLEGAVSGFKDKGCPQRAWATGNIPFENKFFSLLLESPADPPYTPVQMFYNWRTVDGFAPLYAYLGSNGNRVTDLVFSPSRDLILVDQASDRLVVFDLFGEFGILSTPPQN